MKPFERLRLSEKVELSLVGNKSGLRLASRALVIENLWLHVCLIAEKVMPGCFSMSVSEKMKTTRTQKLYCGSRVRHESMKTSLSMEKRSEFVDSTRILQSPPAKRGADFGVGSAELVVYTCGRDTAALVVLQALVATRRGRHTRGQGGEQYRPSPMEPRGFSDATIPSTRKRESSHAVTTSFTSFNDYTPASICGVCHEAAGRDDPAAE